jgi:hypothetical protein
VYNLSMRTPFFFLLSLLISTSAHAYTDFNPGDLSALSDDNVKEMLKTAAIGTGHRAFQPAASLGVAPGLDLGFEVIGIVIPDNFKTAISLATQQPTSQVPTVLPVPRLNIHKGFPFGVDLGFSYATYQQTFTVWGFDAQWNFLKASKAALAGRFNYGKSKLYFIETRNVTVDVLASVGLIVIEPYVGTGFQNWGGDLNVSGATVGLPGGVSASHSGSTGHVFAGVPLKLLFLHITGELDYSFTGLTTYGGKLSFTF